MSEYYLNWTMFDWKNMHTLYIKYRAYKTLSMLNGIIYFEFLNNFYEFYDITWDIRILCHFML